MDIKGLNKTITNTIKSLSNNQTCRVINATGTKFTAFVILSGLSKDDLNLLPQGSDVSQVYKTAYVTTSNIKDNVENGDQLTIGKQSYKVLKVLFYKPVEADVTVAWKLLVVQ